MGEAGDEHRHRLAGLFFAVAISGGYLLILVLIFAPMIALACWIPWLIYGPSSTPARVAYGVYYFMLLLVAITLLLYVLKRFFRTPAEAPG